MRKLWYLFIFMAAVLLSACGSTSSGNTPPGTQPPQAVVPPTEDPNAPKMECTVVSIMPTPGPTQVSIFPPPGEGDWVRGGDDAVLTIVEYSDFQ